MGHPPHDHMCFYRVRGRILGTTTPGAPGSPREAQAGKGRRDGPHRRGSSRQGPAGRAGGTAPTAGGTAPAASPTSPARASIVSHSVPFSLFGAQPFGVDMGEWGHQRLPKMPHIAQDGLLPARVRWTPHLFAPLRDATRPSSGEFVRKSFLDGLMGMRDGVASCGATAAYQSHRGWRARDREKAALARMTPRADSRPHHPTLGGASEKRRIGGRAVSLGVEEKGGGG